MPYRYDVHEESGKKTAEVTGYDGKIRVLSVPAELEGAQVTAIGSHAFAGRSDIEEAVLPQSVTRVGSFAFHGAQKLHTLRITDSIRDWYQGVIRQCPNLRQIVCTVDRGDYSVIRQILSDSDVQLELILHMQDQGHEAEEIRLIFPDYAYISQENTMARCIQFTIEGAGMGFREAVGKKSIDYRGYDRMFSDIVPDNPEVAGDIAVDRLMFPHDLLPAHREMYEKFVRENAGAILLHLVNRQETDKIRFLARSALTDAVSREAALRAASDHGETEICALLMEAGRDQKKTAPAFSLDDW